MSDRPRPSEAALDRYLDGVLPPAEGRAFERDAAGDEWLRAEIEMQREIDGSLRRLFAPPEPGLEAADAGRRKPWRDWLLYAAAAVVLLAAGVVMVPRLLPDPPPLAAVYRTAMESGFRPREVCTTDEEFAGWVERKFGQALHPNPREGVELVGWNYGPVVTAYSGVLLARVEGEEVVVVIDRAASEREEQRSAGRGMRVFRRRIGDLVAYEVTPRRDAAIIDRLSLAPRAE